MAFTDELVWWLSRWGKKLLWFLVFYLHCCHCVKRNTEIELSFSFTKKWRTSNHQFVSHIYMHELLNGIKTERLCRFSVDWSGVGGGRWGQDGGVGITGWVWRGDRDVVKVFQKSTPVHVETKPPASLPRTYLAPCRRCVCVIPPPTMSDIHVWLCLS